jgi:NADH-quinone oxidoreductase subunit N
MPSGLVLNYPTSWAVNDLADISPIVAVVVTLLVVVVLDLVTPPRVRGPVAASVSVVGLLVSFLIAGYRFVAGWGSPNAYFGMASGDRFSLFFEMLFALLGILSVVVASSYVRRRHMLEAELHVLTLAAVAGMMVLAAATSLVSVFLGLETLSIALYVACGFNRAETASQESAAKYLIIGGFASAFVLYGMALVYGATGTTLLSEIARRVTAENATNPLIVLGVILMGVGFAFKISGAPFHQWTPDVYEGAPLPVTAFMSVGTKAAAVAMIIRVFEYGLGHVAVDWQALLAFVSVASMVIGNLVAIVQSSVKRMLAYSGIAHAGYLLIGVIAGGSGIAAVLFYVFAYLFMNFGAFAVVSVLSTADSDRDRFSDLDGLGFRSPTLGVLMSVFMLSLAGFPPMVGFFGKLFLFTAGVQAGWTWLVVIAVLASVVSVYYYLRVLAHVWSPVPEARRALLPPGIRGVQAAALLSAIFTIALGIASGPLLQLGVNGAAPVLLAGR